MYDTLGLMWLLSDICCRLGRSLLKLEGHILMPHMSPTVAFLYISIPVSDVHSRAVLV